LDEILTVIELNELNMPSLDEILQKKIGERVNLKIWQNGEILEKQLTLEAFNE